MIDSYDVKDSRTKTDLIFDLYNRYYDASKSGARTGEELSELLINVGDLFANKVKLGKVSEEEIESVENFLSGFLGENKDKYFNFNHKGLDTAARTVNEGIYVAKEEANKRSMYASPVKSR